MAKPPPKKKLTQAEAVAEIVRRAAAGEAPGPLDAPSELPALVPDQTLLPLDPEKIPRPGDAAFIPAVVESLVDCQGDVNAALRRLHCTFADYLAVSSTAEFKTALNNIVSAKVDIPNRIAVRLAVTENAKGGNAYASKVLHDTRQGETISEDEQRALSELRMADRRTLGRQLESNIKRLMGMLEVVRGRRYSFTEHDADGHEPEIIEPTAADVQADLAQEYDYGDTQSAPDGD